MALIINPALASMLLKEGGRRSQGLKTGRSLFKDGGNNPADIERAGEQPVVPKGAILSTYKRLLEAALNNRVTVVLISFGLLLLIFEFWLLRVGMEKPVEFFPDIDPVSMYVNIDMPEGADLKLCDRIVRQVVG